MSASYSFSLFSRFSPFFLTQEDLQKFYDSPLVFCLSLPPARRLAVTVYGTNMNLTDLCKISTLDRRTLFRKIAVNLEFD